MFDATAGINIKMPLRLELGDVGVTGKVGGASAGNINVKLVNSGSTDWETLTVATHFTIEELSLGDYVITLLPGINDTAGFLEILVWDNNSEATFKTERYVFNIREFKSSINDDSIYIDSFNGVDSAVHPYGSIAYPAKTLTNAVSICGSKELSTIKLIGDENTLYDYLGGSLLYKTILGKPMRKSLLDLGAVQVYRSNIRKCLIRGIMSSNSLESQYEECDTWGTMTLYNRNILNTCRVSHTITLVMATEPTTFFNCRFATSTGGQVGLSLGGTSVIAIINNSSGNVLLEDVVAGSVYLFGFNGDITLDSSCTAGTIHIVGGSGKITDNSGAGCTVNIDGFLVGDGVGGDATLANQETLITTTTFLEELSKGKQEIEDVGGGVYKLKTYDTGDTLILEQLLEKFGGGNIASLTGTATPSIRNKTTI